MNFIAGKYLQITALTRTDKGIELEVSDSCWGITCKLSNVYDGQIRKKILKKGVVIRVDDTSMDDNVLKLVSLIQSLHNPLSLIKIYCRT